MIYAYDDPEYPVAASSTEDPNGLPPAGSKRGRDQASPGSIVQQKKKGPAGPRHSSPIIVPDEPRRCYLNRDNPTLGNGQRVFDLQSIVDANPSANGENANEEGKNDAVENSGSSGFLMPPPPTAIRRSSRTAAWVDGQSPALLDPASNVVSVAPGAAGGAISRQPATSADPTTVSSSSSLNVVSSSRVPSIFKEVKEDNEKLQKEKDENAKKMAAQNEEMSKMKAEMEKMKQEKAEKSRLEKEKKEKKRKEKEEKANAAAAAAAIAAANAAAVEAAKQAAANAAAQQEEAFRRKNDEMREANRLVAEDIARRDAEMEEMRKMMEDMCRQSEEEEEEEEENETEYVPLARQTYEPFVESNRQSRPTHHSPPQFGAGNGFTRASQSVPAGGANLSRAIANICEVDANGRPQGRLQRKTAHLSIMSLPTQNVDASKFSSASDFLMEKRIAMESAKEARPEVKFGGGSVVAFRATMAMFDNNTQSSSFGPREKLIELQKYVSGPPATMVASQMFNSNSAEAYATARRDLEAVYGATPESSWAMLDDIKKGGQIAEDDVIGLQKFLAAAMMTHALAKAADKDGEINRPDRLKEIIEARTEFLIRPFANKLLSVRERERRSLNFEDFRSLISDHISVMQLCKGGKKVKQFAKVAFTSGNDAGNGSGEKSAFDASNQDGSCCALCGKEHQTQYCEQLADLDSDARFKKLIQSNVCVRCMISGHHQKDCPAPPPVCLVCRGRHHSALHRNASSTQRHPAQIRQQNRRQNSETNNAANATTVATSPKTTTSSAQGGSSA